MLNETNKAMNNFAKLRELQNNLKSKGYSKGDKISKSDYVKAVNTRFNMNVTEEDVHKGF